MAFKILILLIVGMMVTLLGTSIIYEPENSVGVYYASPEPDNVDIIDEPGAGDPADTQDPGAPGNEPFGSTTTVGNTQSARGGELEWVYTGAPGAISTPAIVDLDSDGFMEVVYVSAADEIVALDHSGNKLWANSNYIIEPASFFQSEMGLDFWPVDLFSSITIANIDRNPRPEIILGAYNGLVFLNYDGEPKFSQSHTGRYYFSTPVVLDLEGDYSNIDMDGNKLSYYKDMEILTGSDDTNPHAFFEAWHATGGDVFDVKAVQGGESAFVLGIAVGELSGTMEDDKYDEAEKDEAWMEIVFATHDDGMRIFKHTDDEESSEHQHNHPIYEDDTSFSVSGHLSYATPAIGNFSKVINSDHPTQLEIVIGKGGWHGRTPPGNPNVSEKGLYMYDQDGTEHWKVLEDAIIVSSPAVADVQTVDRDEATKKDAEYEIFAANSHEGEIFSVDADDGTIIWQWEIDGGKSESNRIMSSPAIANINSDSELEVIVGSDNGKVYAFDGDPSDGNNDGDEFSYIGEGTTFDLLWEFDTHEHGGTGKIGISSPVVGDIDKDGVLEVLIGDTTGKLWCISAGGTASRGQRDWPMFHYDVNNSGFYDPRVSYSVNVRPARDSETGVIDSMEKFIEPGQMATFNLSIVNDGSGLSMDDYDNIYVTTDVKSDLTNTGWKYTLEGNAVNQHDGLKYVKLPMQEETTVQLNVSAPWSGEMGDYIMIMVKVNSSMDDNAAASITTTTFLKIKMDFTLDFNWLPESDPQAVYFNKKLDEIMPGEERTYSISVQNIGNINDSYRISVADYERGWNIKFLNSDDPLNITVELDSAIFLGAKNSTQIQLSVRVPVDEIGDEVTFITLKGVSLLSEAEQLKSFPRTGLIIREDTMLIKIGDLPKLQLLTEEDEKYIMPGKQAKYKIYVKNNGNVDFSVALSHSEPAVGWLVKMPSAVEVRSLESKLIEVFITAPGEEYQVKAETREMVSIEGLVDTSKGILTSSIGIVGVMDHVYHLNVSVTPAVNSTTPGGMVNYQVSIENLGNGDDTIKLSPLALELGWNMTFSSGDEFLIEWKEFFTIQFEVRVPLNALAGVYISILNVSDSNPFEKNFVTVKTRVLQSYDISVGAYNEDFDQYMSATTQFVTPGSSTMFDIKITNDGNGGDTAGLWLYVYEYQQPSPGGGMSTVRKSAEESDSMLESAKNGGGVKWYIKSVQSSPGAFSTEPLIWDFTEPIDVDSVAEIRYQPLSHLDYATHLSLELYPGQSAWVQVEVEYPADELLDPMYFAFEASSSGEDIKPGNNRANMTLEIKYSDLAFDTSIGNKGLEIIGERTVKSSQMNIRINMRNIGEIDARDIEIALFIDDQYLDSRSVMRLVNSTKDDYKDILISFSWKPIRGEHKIEVKIDPDNSIVEANENNNAVSDTVDIEGGGIRETILSSKNACSIITVILAAVILTVASHYVLKKRKAEKSE